MSDSKFKIGDVVNHKSNKDLKMVIIDNGRFGAGSPTKDLGNKNPNSFLCRYYNSDLKEWKDYQFSDFELSISKE